MNQRQRIPLADVRVRIFPDYGGPDMRAAMSAEVLEREKFPAGDRSPEYAKPDDARGVDVTKALALGADAILLGRAPPWGLAASGEEGAACVIEIVQSDLSRVIAQVGVATPDQWRNARLVDRMAPLVPRSFHNDI